MFFAAKLQKKIHIRKKKLNNFSFFVHYVAFYAQMTRARLYI